MEESQKNEKWSWLKKTFPKVKEFIGDKLPEKGVLGIVKNLISKDESATPEDKMKALQVIQEFELAEMKEVSARWTSDMNSDNKLSKSVRPLTLMFLTLFICTVAVVDSTGLDFGISESYITLFKDLLMLVYFAYFGGRSIEKWKNMSK